MSTDSDQAKSIADRVARRVGSKRSGAARESARANGAPVSEELSAIRAGLQDLESKLERIESKIVNAAQPNSPTTRARVIDFVSSSPPPAGSSSIAAAPAPIVATNAPAFAPVTQSPWLRDLMTNADHPSQERFGVEEATVAELVEYFENEKKCSMEAGDKPCDHCSMCSSRGF